MIAVEQRTSRGRSAVAAGLSAALLLAGVLLALAAGAPVHDAGVPLPLLLAVLVPVYVLTYRYPLEFEFRSESNGVTLTQLPLALGVQVVAPVVHLAARLTASLIGIVLERQAPQKALYNLAAAAIEVGAASFAVGLVEPSDHRADRAGRVAMFGAGAGLRLNDDLPARHVDRDIKRFVAIDERAAEDALHRIGAAKHRHPVAQPMDCGGRQQLHERTPDQLVRLRIEKLADVARDPRDHPVGGQGDQEPDRLDGTEDVNWFAVAIGEIDAGVGFTHV